MPFSSSGRAVTLSTRDDSPLVTVWLRLRNYIYCHCHSVTRSGSGSRCYTDDETRTVMRGVFQCELKRLYTQLQIYKTKTMRQDNPHISKRRGGRKQTHRRFSLQAFHNKHKMHHASASGASMGGGGGGGGVSGGATGGRGGGEHCSIIGGETELSRSPEESVNSAEGVSVYAEESVADVRTPPSVSFKPPHKSRHAS